MDASATQTNRSARRVVAWVLAAAGGIVALVGCLLPWVVLDFGKLAILVQSPTRTLSANGWSLDALGKVALICSIVLLVAAILVAAGSATGARSAFGVVMVVAGTLIGLVAVFEMARKGSYVDHLLRTSFSSSLHRTISDAEFGRLKAVLDRLGFSVSFGVGLYLAVIGGVLGVIGGVLVLVGSSKEPEPVVAGFATFADAGQGPAAPMPPPPAPEAEAPEANVPSPPPLPPEVPPLPVPPDLPSSPPMSADAPVQERPAGDPPAPHLP